MNDVSKASRQGSDAGKWARIEPYLPYLFLALLFCSALAFRPLLPIDETRYLSVSWEMLLRHSFIVPTMNFEPYFQKPPLLFWLIDIVWSLVGVSRASALLVIFAASSLVIYLTGRFARVLFPGNDTLSSRVPWLVLGNIAFAVYSSMILFDMLLTVFILAAMLSFFAFAQGRGLRFALLAGLFIGLGVLTKGPVILIHIGWPVVLYPLWRDRQTGLAPRQFFSGVALSFLVALVPVLLWLVPLVIRMGSGFAYDLIWNQAAGRVAGTLRAAHARPFYFYIVLLPIAALPWLLSPGLWSANSFIRPINRGRISSEDRRTLRFLACWGGGVLLTFSLISGKQPHYLVPLLPLVTLGFAYFMVTVPLSHIRNTAIAVVVILGAVQAIGSQTLFHRYDLTALANYIHERQDADWAFAGNYQGEVTFLARMEKPFEQISADAVKDWLIAHPNGHVIKRFRQSPQEADRVDFSTPVERGYLGVVSAGSIQP